MVVFIATQVIVILGAILTIVWTDAWSALGDFFADLSALGLTGMLAALAVALTAGGLATVRRVAI